MLREAIKNVNEAKPKIFRNETTAKWAIPQGVGKFASAHGQTILGIGDTERNFKVSRDATFVFTSLWKNEKSKEKEFNSVNKNKGERLVRYVTQRTIVDGSSPLCILNADKGYMRFMENIDEDPSLEDAQWSKPEYFDHLRTTY